MTVTVCKCIFTVLWSHGYGVGKELRSVLLEVNTDYLKNLASSLFRDGERPLPGKLLQYISTELLTVLNNIWSTGTHMHLLPSVVLT